MTSALVVVFVGLSVMIGVLVMVRAGHRLCVRKCRRAGHRWSPSGDTHICRRCGRVFGMDKDCVRDHRD